MKVIIHNDDFGHNSGFTRAIADCVRKGITTSVSITVNGADYQKAKLLLATEKFKKIGVGLHLNITDGRAITRELADENGNYKRKFQNYFWELVIKRDSKLLNKIEKDLGEQFEKAKRDKLTIDHVNGHDHIQMIPVIFEIICRLCRKRKIRYIRLAREPYYRTGKIRDDIYPFVNKNIVKWGLLNYLAEENMATLRRYKLKTSEACYGILQTDHMDKKVIESCLKDAIRRKYKLVETVSHPARADKNTKYTSEFFLDYTNRKARGKEKQAMKSRALRRFIEKNGIELVNYARLEFSGGRKN